MSVRRRLTPWLAIALAPLPVAPPAAPPVTGAVGAAVTGAANAVAGSAATLQAPAQPSPAAASPPAAAVQSSEEAGVVAQIDSARGDRRLAALPASAQLTRAAETHALSMARGGYFGHSSADGTPFWQRIARYYPLGGYATWHVGENLLWVATPLAPVDAVEAWLASPEHARILLDPRWRQVGVGVVRADGAPGVFGGDDVTIVVADFGVRSGSR